MLPKFVSNCTCIKYYLKIDPKILLAICAPTEAPRPPPRVFHKLRPNSVPSVLVTELAIVSKRDGWLFWILFSSA